LNGKTINKPSIFVQPGDVITLRNRPNLRKYYREVVDSSSRQSVDWISFDAKDLEARVQTLPVFTDATVPDVQIGRVIAFLSR
jgi:small subunit ribosomal protein S4